MKREIPLKNYFILSILIIITIILTLYFLSWYRTAREYQAENSILTEVVGKINFDEVENYLTDNPNIVIYMASSKDKDIKSFEKTFKDFILENEISDSIIFLDTYNVSNNKYQILENRFVDKLNNRNINLIDCANLLIVRDGEIIDVLYSDNSIIINESDAIQFLEMYEVVEP